MADDPNASVPATAVSITVQGTQALRSLRSWLADEDGLQRRVRLAQAPPQPGQMGSLVETLTVVLAPGGVAAVLAGAVVSWARSQRSDVRVTLRREDGAQAEVVATQLRGLKASALPGVVAGLQRWLDGSPQAGSPAAVDAATADDRESRDDGPVDDSR